MYAICSTQLSSGCIIAKSTKIGFKRYYFAKINKGRKSIIFPIPSRNNPGRGVQVIAIFHYIIPRPPPPQHDNTKIAPAHMRVFNSLVYILCPGVCLLSAKATRNALWRQSPPRTTRRGSPQRAIHSEMRVCVCVYALAGTALLNFHHTEKHSRSDAGRIKKRILLAPRIHIYASPSIPHSSSGMNNLGGETRIYGSEIQTRSSLRFQKRQNLISIVAHGHGTVWILYFILHCHENQDYKYYQLDFSPKL
jgi:hypothetical protein